MGSNFLENLLTHWIFSIFFFVFFYFLYKFFHYFHIFLNILTNIYIFLKLQIFLNFILLIFLLSPLMPKRPYPLYPLNFLPFANCSLVALTPLIALSWSSPFQLVRCPLFWSLRLTCLILLPPYLFCLLPPTPFPLKLLLPLCQLPFASFLFFVYIFFKSHLVPHF